METTIAILTTLLASALSRGVKLRLASGATVASGREPSDAQALVAGLVGLTAPDSDVPMLPDDYATVGRIRQWDCLTLTERSVGGWQLRAHGAAGWALAMAALAATATVAVEPAAGWPHHVGDMADMLADGWQRGNDADALAQTAREIPPPADGAGAESSE